MTFVLFIAIFLYMGYNFLQMLKYAAGKRFENPVFLMFLAAPLDFYYWVKSKI